MPGIDPFQEFYTSDYDLSQFESYKQGLGIRYGPFSKKKRLTSKEVIDVLMLELKRKKNESISKSDNEGVSNGLSRD